LRFDFFDISSQSLYNVHSMVELSHLSTHEREALDVFVERLYAYCGDRVRLAVLFGSKARGNASPDSDVEVLVALTNDDPRLRSQVRRLSARVSLECDLLLSIQSVGRLAVENAGSLPFPLYRVIESGGIDLTPQPT
jgi:predicted nucleotidyltransferase